MAVQNPVLINSSTPLALRIQAITPPSARSKSKSSSPQLPSPSTLVQAHVNGLGNGSQSQQILDCPNANFTLASHALELQHQVAKTPKQTTGKLKKTKKAVYASESKKAREPVVDRSEYTFNAPLDEGKVRASSKPAKQTKKPRKREPKSESIIINSDDSEPACNSAAPKRRKVSAEAVSPTRGPEISEKSTYFANFDVSEAAFRRRLSWTPAKNTDHARLPVDRPTTADSKASAETDAGASLPRVPLSELLGNFGYINQNAVTVPDRGQTGEALTKRCRIELADLATVSVMSRKTGKVPSLEAEDMAPLRVKKPSKSPKKAQTITALAIKPYQLPKPQESEQKVVSELLTSHPEKPSDRKRTAQGSTDAVTKPKKARKARTKKTDDVAAVFITKKPSKVKKPKVTFKEADYRPQLYSPERASKQMQQQAFLFGTSSQLAVENSPTSVQESQTMMQGVEALLGSQAVASAQKKSCAKVPTAPHGTSLSVEQAERDLWCSAARNSNGGLLVEKCSGPGVGLASAAVPEDQQKLDRMLGGQKLQNLDVHIENSKQTTIDLCYSSPVSIASPYQEAMASDAQRHIPEPAQTKHTKFASEPFAQEASWLNIDDISDSDTPTTPSPPRRRESSSPFPAQVLELGLVGSTSIKTTASAPAAAAGVALKPTDPQWLNMLRNLFPRITTAVKASAPSLNPSIPSWHEKILLYDPIDLEDLTAWLNEQGLRVAVRRLKPKEKKKRGRPKKDDRHMEYEVQEEELQPYMVQKWCEEKSVCCLWKGGVRSGWRAR